ncbi:MAG: threonine/serine dehydratase [Chloroflexota bacterium]|nr:threonine/serine dehydratase [Chloroflexota bacterium]
MGTVPHGSQQNAVASPTAIPVPTLADVYAARQAIAPYLRPTPLLHNAALSEYLGFDLFLKCENLQPIGAFKVRGGLNLMRSLDPAYREAGVVTASTGNHGQSIAYAAREFGVRATIYMPEAANPLKVASMQRLGAEVVFAGKDFDEARLRSIEDAERTGRYYVHTVNEPAIIAGVATCTLEILETIPQLDVLIVPVGGGSGVSGSLVAGKAINPDLRVVAVQAAGAPAVHDSWRERTLHAYDSVSTFAEGLATRSSFAYPLEIMWERLDDFVLVEDAMMQRAMLALLETSRIVAEGAGAAATAAAMNLRAEFAGKSVCCVVSGGNVPLAGLRDLLAQGDGQWRG